MFKRILTDFAFWKGLLENVDDFAAFPPVQIQRNLSKNRIINRNDASSATTCLAYLVGARVDVVPVARFFLPFFVCSYMDGDEIGAFLFGILGLVHAGYAILAGRVADSDETFPLLDDNGYAGIER